MNQPRLQVETVHLAETSMLGAVYQKLSRTFEVTITAAGSVVLWKIPAGTFIDRVVAQVQTALNGSGTFEVGVDSNADELIDTADYTETNADAWATNVGSSNADQPNGKYYPSLADLKATVGGTPTAGKVRVLVEYWMLDDMFDGSFGSNLSVSV